jgi:uncharacterized SAM-binding protein YcdF (DUF218 family)
MPRPRRAALPLLLLLATVTAAVLLWKPTLKFLANYPDVGQPPVKADAIVVLAGGWRGERILKASELIRDGYAPYALVSSPNYWYDMPECEAAKAFATRRGFPESPLVCVPVTAQSTREEVQQISPALRERNARRILLVSVSLHLRRAATLMREAAPGVSVVPIAAPPPDYDIARWYRHREGRKAVFLEWVKLLTYPLGL